MSSHTNRYLIAAALSCGANIALYEGDLSDAEASRLRRLLSGLAQLGHIASFTIDRAQSPGDSAMILEALRCRWDFVVDALLAADQIQCDCPPAYLMPVWPFDHERPGQPASTARFLHLDLEVIATPTADEELGVSLPGRTGQWLVHARPLLF